MKKIHWMLCCTMLVCLNSTAALSLSKPMNVFGLKDSAQSNDNKPERLYMLQLGAFEQSENASRYKENLERVTQKPAHITVQEQGERTFHCVFIGPLDSKALREVRHALLQPPAQAANIVKVAEPQLPHHFSLKNGHMPFQIGFFNKQQNIGSQSINIQGLIGDRFTVTSQNKENILFGLGYFVDGAELEHANLMYGVNAYYLARTTVRGQVYQEHLFNNLSYQYTQTNVPLYASVKAALKPKYNKLSLLLNAGIGPNIMQTANFSETSLDGGRTLPDNIFLGKNKVNFSATAGVSARIDQILGNVPLECGYQFFYLGEGTFERQTTQVTNTLKTGTSYAQALVCSVTL